MRSKVISVLAWVVLGLTSSLSAAASAGSYEELAKKFSRAYSSKGQDNNSLDFTVSEEAATSIAPDAAVLPSAEEIKDAIARCVFMPQGAYGAHITAKAQAALTRSFMSAIRELALSNHDQLAYYLSQEVINEGSTLGGQPNCSVIIEVNGKSSLRLNATMMD